MVRGTRRPSAPAMVDPRPDDSTAFLPPPRSTSARWGRGGGSRLGAAAADELPVDRSAVVPTLTCGICNGLLRDATTISECLHACNAYIYDKLTESRKCPTCDIFLGPAPLEKLRSMLFHAKRRNVNAVSTTNKKRKEKVSTESTISLGEITAPHPQEHGIEVEVINEADEGSLAQESVYESSILNLAPVGRDALSRIRCRDFYSACHLNAETGALIMWQPAAPIPEEMVAHDQLAPRQYSQTFGPPATSDTEYQRQAPAVQMTNNTPVVAGSSFHARITVQDDDNLRGDILALFNESTAKIMGRYDTHIGQLKAENSKLTEQLGKERATALERTRMLEERHQQELEKERASAAERTRMLEERQQELEKERAAAAKRIRITEENLQRESEIATSARNRIRSLEAQNAIFNEGLKNGRAENQALMSDIAKKSDELVTLKYHCDMFESNKKDLQNQVENLKKELEYTQREHARYVCQVLEAANRVPMQLGGVDPMYTTPMRAHALPPNSESN